MRRLQAVLGALILAVSSVALADPPKVCRLIEVSDPKAAELRVYFTKFESEDKTEGKYRSCRLVKKTEPGAVAFYVTRFRHDATTVVHAKNWPHR